MLECEIVCSFHQFVYAVFEGRIYSLLILRRIVASYLVTGNGHQDCKVREMVTLADGVSAIGAIGYVPTTLIRPMTLESPRKLLRFIQTLLR